MKINEEEIAIPSNEEELGIARNKSQEKVELVFLRKILSQTGGNVTQAAQNAGMNRSWLSELISRHKLDLNKFKSVG